MSARRGLGVWRAALLAAWAAFAAFALWGVPRVPFHPDEATYLYMSRDFDLLLAGEARALSWQAAGQPAAVLRYRRMDSPLSRLLPGLGRALAGRGPLERDWDWSATWEANVQAGALPTAGLLTAARLPATLLAAASPLLVYALGSRLGGPAVGAIAGGLYALSGLLLLHGRRAMAEGPLVFLVLLSVWLLLSQPQRPALAGLAAALALSAKATAGLLLPAAGLALLWPGSPRPWRARLSALAVFGLVWALGVWLLNPALWDMPVAGLRAMWAERQHWLADQAMVTQVLAPQARLAPGMRLLAIPYQVFFAPLAYSDVGNYAAYTHAAEVAYQANPLNLGLRALPATASGGVWLALALLGLIAGGGRLLARPAAPERRVLGVLLAWTAATVLAVLAIPVPVQRYYLPLLPIACLWAAYGLAELWHAARQARARPPA